MPGDLSCIPWARIRYDLRSALRARRWLFLQIIGGDSFAIGGLLFGSSPACGAGMGSRSEEGGGDEGRSTKRSV